MYEKLWENGCILSEYPPGTQPHSRLFPPRNRIISALSDLVLVIEAREKSGTLITVDMALEQGKDVFAVPGRITDTCSRGCNRLIGNGAGIAVSVAQLLQELQGSVPHAGRDETFSLAQAERPNAAKAAGVIADKMLCPVTDALSSTASSSWPPSAQNDLAGAGYNAAEHGRNCGYPCETEDIHKCADADAGACFSGAGGRCRKRNGAILQENFCLQ